MIHNAIFIMKTYDHLPNTQIIVIAYLLSDIFNDSNI